MKYKTDNAIPKYDGTTGKIIQGSSITISDADNILIPNNKEIRFLDSGATERTALELDASNNLQIGNEKKETQSNYKA